MELEERQLGKRLLVIAHTSGGVSHLALLGGTLDNLGGTFEEPWGCLGGTLGCLGGTMGEPGVRLETRNRENTETRDSLGKNPRLETDRETLGEPWGTFRRLH